MTKEPQSSIAIIPEPKKICINAGKFRISKKTRIEIAGRVKEGELRRIALFLGRKIEERLKVKLNTTPKKQQKQSIKLTITNSVKLKDLGPEGYRLQINTEGVSILSTTPQGIFYGIQTLLQIIQAKGSTIPCLEIEDWPSLPLRGIHIDLKYQMPKFQYLLEIIDTLSYYKINCVLLEYENKFPFKSHPLLPSQLALSGSEVKRLLNYCKARYVKVIPMLHSVNWIGYVLQHQEYAHLREQPDSIIQACPLNPGTFQLFKELYNEMLPHHKDADYFHIGGDELRNLGACPKCKSKAQQENRFKLYFDYIRKVGDYVRQSGKIPLIWGDMLVNDPPQNKKDMKKIAGDFIILYWDYWSDGKKVDWVLLGSVASKFKGAVDKNTVKKLPRAIYTRFKKYWDTEDGSFPRKFKGFPYLRYYQDMGVRTIVCPGTQSFGDNYNCPRYSLYLPNISEFCKRAVENNAFGVINTNWTMHRVPWEVTWPGHICSAEFSWSGKQISLSAFEKKFVKNYWGIDDVSPFDLMRTISISAIFWDKGHPLGTSSRGCLPYTKADLFIGRYPILKQEIRKFEETPSKREILASLPKLAARTSQSAQTISKLINQAKYNKLSLRHIHLAAKATEHKASQVLCFHECEELLGTRHPSVKKLDECIALLEKLLSEMKELSARTQHLLSLSLVKEEVEDAIVRRYTQEEKVMKDYLENMFSKRERTGRSER